MSDASNTNGDGLDLSALNFGPSWAKDNANKDDYSNYEVKEKSFDKRKGKGRNDRNSRPGGGGGRDQRRDNNSRDNRGPRRDGGRRDGDRPRYTPVASPEGFTGEVMPIEEGLDRLAKQILQTARTYSVFDLARMVLQSRERFNVGLKAPKGTKIFRNTSTASTFLTKEESMEDFWKSDVKEKFYKEVKKEVEAPSGNYPSVAKCTKSGVYLGPPNHHSYQSKLREHHREWFATVPFEVYQRGIQVIQGEEAVNEWVEQQKYHIYYLPISNIPTAVEAPKEEAPAVAEETESTEETPAVSEDAVNVEANSEESGAVPEEEASINADDVDDSLLLKSRLELERHFMINHFDEAYKQVQISWVPSSIPGKMLSPALLTLLKETVSEEKRYPGKLSSLMCRQLSGRNVAVFKLNKKLKAGPSRPHALPDLNTLADRPKSLLEWTSKNNGKGIDALWGEVLPKEVSDEEKAEWFHDLKWLLTQGYVSLQEDGTLYSSKKETKDEPKNKSVAKKTKGNKPSDKNQVKSSGSDKTVVAPKASKKKEQTSSESKEEEISLENLITDSDIIQLEISQKIDTLSTFARERDKKLLAEAQQKERGMKKVSNITKALAARGIRSGSKVSAPKTLPAALKQVSQG